MTSAPDLWTFATTVYAEPDLAARLIAAQDRQGLDVPVLLWAAWVGWAKGHVLSPEEMAAAAASVAAWSRDVVRPLRAVRRRLKHGPSPAPTTGTEALRARVLEAELEAERQLLALLERLPLTDPTRRPSADALAHNLSCVGAPAAAFTEALHLAARRHFADCASVQRRPAGD